MAPRTATVRRLLAALGLTVTALVAAGCSSAPPVVAPPPPAPSAEAPSSSEPSSTEPPPTTLAPLPLARDGSNLTACQSGHCQVLISGPTTLTVRGLTLTATPNSGGVTVSSSDANNNSIQIGTSTGGSNTIGLGGHSVTVRVLGVQGDRAVLDLS